VEPHADPNRPSFEGAPRLARRRHRIGCPRERDEERVALRVHLDAFVAREREPDRAVMLGEHLGVPVAELAQESRRALDVREEERHGPGGQVAHRSRMTRPPGEGQGVRDRREAAGQRVVVARPP
jgi:hypothetical protein